MNTGPLIVGGVFFALAGVGLVLLWLDKRKSDNHEMSSESERNFYAKFNSLPAEKVAQAHQFADEMLLQQTRNINGGAHDPGL